MTRVQLAIIVIVPLLIVVLLTAVDRWCGVGMDGLTLGAAIGSALFLIFYFIRKPHTPKDGAP